MATRADTFYPSSTDQDFIAPDETDIRKLVETVGGSDNTTQASFGTGTAEIVLNPFTTRSTTGTASASRFGWAINRDGADGMAVPAPPAGVDDAVRFIAAGTWTFNGRLGAALVTTGTYRMRVRVYRVTSSGSRTLLFGPISSGGVSPATTGSDVTATTSEPEYTFDDDETLLVSYSIEKTASSVGAETIQFRLNDTLGNDCDIVLPSGVRTRFLASETVSASATAVRQFLTGIPRATSAVGTAVMARTVTASKSAQVTAVGTAASVKAVELAPIATTSVGTVSGRIELPLDEVPTTDVGDLPGTDASISGTVFTRAGARQSGATVLLFRQSDNQFISQTTSDANGAYRFDRNAADSALYFVTAFTTDDDGGHSHRSLNVVPD